jgi:hypothetical protein
MTAKELLDQLGEIVEKFPHLADATIRFAHASKHATVEADRVLVDFGRTEVHLVHIEGWEKEQ